MAAEFIWPTHPAPANPDAVDTVGYELGVKFQASVAGNIKEIWWWEAPTSKTTAWKVNLWDSAGNNLANKTVVAGITKGAWNSVVLDTPVAIIANTTYVASVNVSAVAAESHYPADGAGLAASVVSGHLATVADNNNGVFNLTEGLFPATSFNNSNYWRDVAFEVPTVAAAVEAPAVPGGGGVVARNRWAEQKVKRTKLLDDEDEELLMLVKTLAPQIIQGDGF